MLRQDDLPSTAGPLSTVRFAQAPALPAIAIGISDVAAVGELQVTFPPGACRWRSTGSPAAPAAAPPGGVVGWRWPSQRPGDVHPARRAEVSIGSIGRRQPGWWCRSRHRYAAPEQLTDLVEGLAGGGGQGVELGVNRRGDTYRRRARTGTAPRSSTSAGDHVVQVTSQTVAFSAITRSWDYSLARVLSCRRLSVEVASSSGGHQPADQREEHGQANTRRATRCAPPPG